MEADQPNMDGAVTLSSSCFKQCPPLLTQLIANPGAGGPRQAVRREEAQRVDVECDAHHAHGGFGARQQTRQDHDHLGGRGGHGEEEAEGGDRGERGEYKQR